MLGQDIEIIAAAFSGLVIREGFGKLSTIGNFLIKAFNYSCTFKTKGAIKRKLVIPLPKFRYFPMFF
jgi:hypothetical protein